MDDCRATLFPRELLSVQRLAIDWRRHNYMETQDGLRSETEDRLPVEDVAAETADRDAPAMRGECGAGWSPWTDIKLLLRTIPYMVARRGL